MGGQIMGMDVYGNNPKENLPKEEFPVYKQYEEMEFTERWKHLDADEKLRTTYWKQMQEYEEHNVGTYFRNNCWWWRPLWDYCHFIAPDLISEELWADGHNNSGSGLDHLGAKELGQRLIKTLDDGYADTYIKEYELNAEQKKKDGDEFATSYPIDRENIERFARFCLECGGFSIR